MEYRRHRRAGGSYFFTLVTFDRLPLLTGHIERLRRAFSVTRMRHPFTLDAVVVLPDHLHAVWTLPPGDDDYPLRWRVLKRLFSSGIESGSTNPSRAARREKAVWQRRYWEHTLRDREDWRRHVDYIHYNPVRHGYAAAPMAWPYSSFGPAVKSGWYTPDWGASSEPEGIASMRLE